MSASARRSSSSLPGHVGGSAGRSARRRHRERPLAGGLPKIPDPCKSGETGRIIDSAPKFARVVFDKAIWISYLKAVYGSNEQGADFALQGGESVYQGDNRGGTRESTSRVQTKFIEIILLPY
jgi:hypothetical protein